MDYLPLQHNAESLKGRGPARFLQLLFYRYRMKLLLSVLFFLIKHSPVYVLPVVTANLINLTIHPSEHSLQQIWFNLIALAVVIVQNIPTQILHIGYMSKAIRFAEAELRSLLVRKLQRLSMSAHGELISGKLQSKLLRDVEAIEYLSRQIMLALIPSILSIVIAIAMTASRSLLVTCFFVLTIPISQLIMTIFKNKIRLSNRAFRKQVESMSGQVGEMVEMIPITKAHGLEQTEINKIDQTLKHLRDKGYRLDIIEAYFGSSSWVAFQLFQALCLGFTVWLALQGRIPVGDIVLYQSLFGMILNSVSNLLNVYPIIAKGFESIDSVTEILVSQDIEPYQGKRKLERIVGEFWIESVHFSYPDTSRHVLNDFSLRDAG